MNDLISRSALLAKMKRTSRYFDVKFDIEEMPAVDAVPVVRCKDCIYYEPLRVLAFDETTKRHKYSEIIEKPYGMCHGFRFTEHGCLRVAQNNFCNYGERRNGDAG